jgi:putative transposase
LKDHFFCGSARCAVLQRGLLKVLADAAWHLEAWAVFSNHYHFVAHSPRDKEGARSLQDALRELHSKTAIWVNRLDKTPGRTVWHNYWETQLTFQNSYLARLSYVHQNPVRHGLVAVAREYPWCSAAWFERVASPAIVKTIYRFKTDSLDVLDEYEPAREW